MREIVFSTKFKKDIKHFKNNQKVLDEIFAIIELLANDKPMPEKCVPHQLQGEYKGVTDCHVRPDVILLYRLKDTIKDGNVITELSLLELLRVGSHSQLFK